MTVLSKNDIETIGESVLRDYTRRFPVSARTPVDIEQFAGGYLKLKVEFRRLSDSGNLLGILTYQGIHLELTLNGGNRVISVPEDTILLEERLYSSGNIRRLRFTIAHECAHQIIAKIEQKQTGVSYRRDLTAANDRSEGQANTLAAALLMPRPELIRLMDNRYKPFRPSLFGHRFNSMDYLRIRELADRFQVSVTAMIIRLKELGLVICKPKYAYCDPQDIMPEGEMI